MHGTVPPRRPLPARAIVQMRFGLRARAVGTSFNLLRWGTSAKACPAWLSGECKRNAADNESEERGADPVARRPLSLIHASVVSLWFPSLIRYRGTGYNVAERRTYREDGHEPSENPRRHRYARLEPRGAFYLDHGNSPSRMPARSPNFRKRRPFQRKPRLAAVTQPGLCALWYLSVSPRIQSGHAAPHHLLLYHAKRGFAVG